MNIKATSEGLIKDVIIDRRLMEENLNSAGLDSVWIKAQLNKQNIQDISEVLYGGIYANNKLHV